MNEKEKLKNTLIDKHYNENYDINLLNRSTNAADFDHKIDVALEKMDLTDNIDFNIDIDTLNIIQQAEQIQIKNNSLKENVYFIITSALILFLFGVVFLVLGIKFLVYFQLILVFIMPWCLIPLAKYTLRRNQNE